MKDEQIRQFIREHLHDPDLHRLLLSAGKYPELPMPYVVQQIQALRKLQDKAPGWYDPDLRMPPSLSIEQASSEVTAKFKSGLFSGHSMADLTGGLGIDSFYFAQRFERVWYVEQQPGLVEIARHNFSVKGQSNIKCVAAAAEDFLQSGGPDFDLIYLDPARRGDQQQKVFRLKDCSPDVTALRARLLERSPKVLLKTAPMLDIQAAVSDLQQVARIWVVALGNEVKEVLYLLKRQHPGADSIPVTAVNLDSGQPEFTFTREEEATAEVRYGPPQQWIYEPNAAILKAGAFRSFAARYGLTKLHPNTHVYTSAEWVAGIPGRCFRLSGTCKYDKKAVRALLPEPRGNMTTRNFPEGVDAVRKKLGLADGGRYQVFAVTTLEGLRLLVGERHD